MFSDFRQPAAEQAYEVAFDYLDRSGAIRDEFEACIFLAQRLMAMIEDGQTNKIRMANRAISEYERDVAQWNKSAAEPFRRHGRHRDRQRG